MASRHAESAWLSEISSRPSRCSFPQRGGCLQMNRPHGAWVGYIDLLLTLKFERQPVATQRQRILLGSAVAAPGRFAADCHRLSLNAPSAERHAWSNRREPEPATSNGIRRTYPPACLFRMAPSIVRHALGRVQLVDPAEAARAARAPVPARSPVPTRASGSSALCKRDVRGKRPADSRGWARIRGLAQGALTGGPRRPAPVRSWGRPRSPARGRPSRRGGR